MTRFVEKSVVISFVVLIMSGCQSHQSKVDSLQKEYDVAAQKYRTDCSAEVLNMPKELSPRCADEQKRMNDAYQRLQAEQKRQ